jgi:hypothetical protein
MPPMTRPPTTPTTVPTMIASGELVDTPLVGIEEAGDVTLPARVGMVAVPVAVPVAVAVAAEAASAAISPDTSMPIRLQFEIARDPMVDRSFVLQCSLTQLKTSFV